MNDLIRLSELLTKHLKLGISGKCTCGHEIPLGTRFTDHQAAMVMAAGWRPVR